MFAQVVVDDRDIRKALTSPVKSEFVWYLTEPVPKELSVRFGKGPGTIDMKRSLDMQGTRCTLTLLAASTICFSRRPSFTSARTSIMAEVTIRDLID